MKFKYYSIVAMAALGLAACQDAKLAGSGQVPVGSAVAVDADRDGIPDGAIPVSKVTKEAPSSPTGSVQLLIKDAATGAPIKDQEFQINVSRPVYDNKGKLVAQPAVKSKTDESGYVTLNYIPFGDFVWSISNDAYMPASDTFKLQNTSGSMNLVVDNPTQFIGTVYLLKKTKTLNLTVTGSHKKTATKGIFLAPDDTYVQIDVPTYLVKLANSSVNDLALPAGIVTLSGKTKNGVVSFAGMPDVSNMVAITPSSFNIRVVVSPFAGGYLQEKPELVDATRIRAGAYNVSLEPLILDARMLDPFGVVSTNLIKAKAITGVRLETSEDQTWTAPVSALASNEPIRIIFNQPVNLASAVVGVINNYPHQIKNDEIGVLNDSTAVFDGETFLLTPAVNMGTYNQNLTISLDPSGTVATIAPKEGVVWKEGAEYFVAGGFSAAASHVDAARNISLYGMGFYVKPALPTATNPAITADYALRRGRAEDSSGFVGNVASEILVKLSQPVKLVGSDEPTLLFAVDDAAYSGAAAYQRNTDGTVDMGKPLVNLRYSEVFFDPKNGTGVQKLLQLDYGEAPTADYKLKSNDMGSFLSMVAENAENVQLAPGYAQYFRVKFGGYRMKRNSDNIWEFNNNTAAPDCVPHAGSFDHTTIELEKGDGILPSSTATVQDPTVAGMPKEATFSNALNKNAVFSIAANSSILTIRSGEIKSCKGKDAQNKDILIKKKVTANQFSALAAGVPPVRFLSNNKYNFDLMDMFNSMNGGKHEFARANVFLPATSTKLHLAASNHKEIKLKLYINPVVDGKPYDAHKLVDMNGSPLPSSVVDLTVNADKAKLTRPMTVPQNSVLRPQDGDPEVVIFHTSAYAD